MRPNLDLESLQLAQEEIAPEEPTYIKKLNKFFEVENICDELDEEELQQIYSDAQGEFDSSFSLMDSKVQEWKNDLKLVLLQSDRNTPFPGASDVVYPLSSNAVINLASKAFNAFFPDNDIYKGQIVGKDDGIIETKNGVPVINPETQQPIRVDIGVKATTANRLATVMNYQVENLITNWKKDTIQLFYICFTLGTVYRKEGYDFLKRRNFSSIILPDRIVVNKNISTLENSIYSEIFYLTKNEIQAHINRGLFVDYDYETNIPASKDQQLNLAIDSNNTTTAASTSKEDEEYKFIEQHTFLDLDNDGFKEPYSVIIDMSSQKVVRIVPDYKLDTVTATDDGVIYDIPRIQNLVCYRCFPSFDGTFFGIGLPYFLTNINSSINSSINQLIDSMHLKIKGGGFVSNDGNLRAGAFTYKMGEFKKVMFLSSGNLADKFFIPPVPEPSPVMLALLELMINSGKDIGLLRDVLTGNVAANMAPTTFLGLTENAVSIENSIFKSLNESFKEEIRIRRRLNAEFFDPALYEKITGEKLTDVSPSLDFLSENVEVVLLTDTSSITKSQKMAKAQLFSTLTQDAYYNPIEIRKKFNEAIGMPELNEIMAPPPPSPDANLMIAEAEGKKADAKLLDSQVKAEETFAKIDQMASKLVEMEADIKLKESQVIKNIAEASEKQKQGTLKEIKDFEEAIAKSIELQLRDKQIELQREQIQLNKQTDNNKTDNNDTRETDDRQNSSAGAE